MQIHIVEDYQQLSAKAASIVASQVILKSNSVLGLATGSTPEGMYRGLVQMHQAGTVDFNGVVTFNLDEYLGLSSEHPQSYHYFMHQHLFNHINVLPENIHIPSGQAEDMAKYCLEYDQKIAAAGGIDLQVLGIGGNGHIGFNEPHQYLNVQTQVVDLTEETIEANSRFFATAQEVPGQAVTMGMGSIMKAQRILLLASGKNKAAVIKETVSGKISTEIPASFLQLHRELILVLDKEVASLL
ncbi:MAG: glucosamine-6-phosphate deaminase [Candidatus Contubernalis sp.]|nr:glucosamine-6-phosphate deaminase [Candidatus Contubernalis sp.]